jgi:hypothetical protein
MMIVVVIKGGGVWRLRLVVPCARGVESVEAVEAVEVMKGARTPCIVVGLE